jgi:hypothetical protein
MGPHSNEVLARMPWAHELDLDDSVGILLAIREQDPTGSQQFDNRLQDNHNEVDALRSALAGDTFLKNGTGVGQGTLDTVIDEIGSLMSTWGYTQTLGLVEIKIDDGRLAVKAVGAHTTVLTQRTERSAVVEVSGFLSTYRLGLVLEPDDRPRPKQRVFLDTDDDACGEPTLYVESKNGNVAIHKGETKDVYVKDDEYTWHCGDLDTDDTSNAPDATNLAVTTRAYSGGKITWKWFAEHALSPDLF